jgi:hypothetical protein
MRAEGTSTSERRRIAGAAVRMPIP